MPDNRYYLLKPYEVGIEVILEGEEKEHLCKVMRKKEGDPVELINGKGMLAAGKITALSKKEATIRIESLETTPPPPKRTLALALIRQNRLEIAVEKCTELGITHFILFPAEKSERQEVSENHKKRLENIAISAMKQSGTLFLPQFTFLKKWEKPEGNLYVAQMGGEKKNPLTLPATLFIGPESGWSQSELQKLQEWQAKAISLSETILRAETAAIVGAAQFYFL